MALRSFQSLVFSKFLPTRICNQAVGPGRSAISLLHDYLNQLCQPRRSNVLEAMTSGLQKFVDRATTTHESVERFATLIRVQDRQFKGQILWQSNLIAMLLLSTSAGIALAKADADDLGHETKHDAQLMGKLNLWVPRMPRRPRVYNRTPRSYQGRIYPVSVVGDEELPKRVDWRERGAVTPVKNQGSCGTCSLFAVVGSAEAVHFMKTGRLQSLSEQQILDCNDWDGSCVCGGSARQILIYILMNGLTTTSRYPYRAKRCWCKYKAKVARISDFTRAGAGEKGLMKAVSLQPVVVYIDASGLDFVRNRGEIIRYSKEQSTPNHMVLLIGYDTAEDGTKYWSIKNSWDKIGGDGGFGYLERGVDDPKGTCGILRSPAYIPIA